jgi:hypothetical protein
LTGILEVFGQKVDRVADWTDRYSSLSPGKFHDSTVRHKRQQLLPSMTLPNHHSFHPVVGPHTNSVPDGVVG